MSREFHLSADIPPELDDGERLAVRAKAYAVALNHAAHDPNFRLKMILGEGHQRFLDLAGWVAGEIARDEALAPGIIEWARTASTDPAAWTRLFPAGTSTDVIAAQTSLLRAAVDKTRPATAPQLEGSPCTDMTPTTSGSAS